MRKSAKSFSLHSNALWKLIIVALATVLLSATLTAQNQIVTGKKITPAGFNGEIASLPMNIILSPDGKFAIVLWCGLRSGWRTGLHVVRCPR